ncbi:ATP-binding cassette domain-containing protein [Ensifer sp. YR511]|uniref:ATP-binding cassette domain-containing protein n=1 Tax=Ensifer sp. YR511 TaxID=1855294 RepID=UPI0008866661|nr:sugar ABC transporter ATP-binding protein [Ensifer sp. YR511]SDN35401.1 ribose transport system ATP-binding protein [Ensifer sp. YR511]
MALILRNISKIYGPVHALDDVSLTVEPGECRALYGGNGSGKSTTARIVSGSVAASSGSVEIDGHPLDIPSPRRARTMGIGVTFQELSLLPDLTAAENVVIGDAPRHLGFFVDRRRLREDAYQYLNEIGLAHFCDVKASALQTGEKYLTELAKALYLKPRYIIIDELTTTLHASEVEVFARLIERHLAGGGGALFVSHRLNELRRFCSTITVLHNGRHVADERLEVVSDADLVGWAGGREQTPASAVTVAAPANRATAIQIERLSLGRKAVPLALALPAGEIVGLGGVPDQGQKTLLRILAGLAPAGRDAVISIMGKPLSFNSAAGAAAAGIVFVAGDRDQMAFATRSIRENMLAPFIARGAPLPDDVSLRSALSLLSTRYAGLDMPMNSLSGGNQQKVLIARCLLADPAILIAEDPTKGIDVGARADVHRLFRDLSAKGTTVLVTSSDDLELADLCDRVLVMEGGAIAANLARSAGSLSVQAIVAAYMKQEKAA